MAGKLADTAQNWKAMMVSRGQLARTTPAPTPIVAAHLMQGLAFVERQANFAINICRPVIVTPGLTRGPASSSLQP